MYKKYSCYRNYEFKIRKILYNFGISASLKGYNYLVDAIKLAKSNNNLKITKDIYPILSLKYNTKPSNIESAIRNAIEIGMTKTKHTLIENVFSNTICWTKGKPTNLEFIITLSMII